ncbi:glucosidase II [Tieghemiomyces parasiticus]|uniref:Glucosidase II subunit alpha n=1 Tax=Tieghemiomyces parasiticus TaxID=78921 RepID=A0A9W8A8D2_9FUNG|nr:glucosidase II [Tieghemiomyces parasiticus]
MHIRYTALCCLLALPAWVAAVKQEDFKTCDEATFCRRNRNYAGLIRDTLRPADGSVPAQPLPDQHHLSPFGLVAGTVSLQAGTFEADVYHATFGSTLRLHVDLLRAGTARVRLVEKDPIRPRYTGLEDFVLLPNAIDRDPAASLTTTANVHELCFARQAGPPAVEHLVRVHTSPLHLAFVRRTQSAGSDEWTEDTLVEMNGDGFLAYEEHRTRESDEALRNRLDQTDSAHRYLKPLLDDNGRWEERFKTWTDSKPYGPASVAVDLKFPGFEHVYGIPEHATSFSLPTTRGPDARYSEPYRLYNLDVFEYILDSPMALYGSIPYLTAHRANHSVAVFWLNAAETWVDVEKYGGATSTHWMSESGNLDFFVLYGDAKPATVLEQYAALTGPTALPPAFSVAYHQSRWNYNSQDDVADVDAHFDTYDIPYDVIWLDIEHTNDKRYFTWDARHFADPEGMQRKLSVHQRKLVTIVDPHIKADQGYYVAKEGREHGYFIKRPDGTTDFEGWCWPGNSYYVDYHNPQAAQWWADKFRLDSYQGSTPNLFIWNDMNEPSVFSGPEITLMKDALHHGGVEHREVHNVFGLMFHNASAVGVRDRLLPAGTSHESTTELYRHDQRRPFVLSRAYFAGTQRVSAVWTGDNTATWDQLAASIPMILSNTVAGLHFIGADVGGFFGNPDAELLTRWYQAAAFQPFFRAHAHIDSLRREPWLLGAPYTDVVREAIRLRYHLLPYVYGLFYGAHTRNTPVMRPMYFEFPADPEALTMDDQALLGPAVLYKPATQPGQTTTTVYLPPANPWYDFHTGHRADRVGSPRVEVATPLDTIAAFVRGGTIHPQRLRNRASSTLMRYDPLTLVVALGTHGEATGELYLDDEETFAYTFGHRIHRTLTYTRDHRLTSTAYVSPAADAFTRGDAQHPVPADGQRVSEAQAIVMRNLAKVRVERVEILGLKRIPRLITVVSGQDTTTPPKHLAFHCNGKSDEYVCEVVDPACHVADDWTIAVEFDE